jgi:hypothetical protein
MSPERQEQFSVAIRGSMSDLAILHPLRLRRITSVLPTIREKEADRPGRSEPVPGHEPGACPKQRVISSVQLIAYLLCHSYCGSFRR